MFHYFSGMILNMYGKLNRELLCIFLKKRSTIWIALKVKIKKKRSNNNISQYLISFMRSVLFVMKISMMMKVPISQEHNKYVHIDIHYMYYWYNIKCNMEIVCIKSFFLFCKSFFLLYALTGILYILYQHLLLNLLLMHVVHYKVYMLQIINIIIR